jgi:hypothetical protein
MKNQNFLPSSHVEEIKDYPFGRHRTTGTAFLEFSPKKGFRFVRQLRDPKTGRFCAPKKSTYYEIALPIIDENGYFSFTNFDLNRKIEELPGAYNLIADQWHLWTKEQQYYILRMVLVYSKVAIRAAYEYSGLNPSNNVELSEVLPIFETVIKRAKEGLNGSNGNPLRNCSPNIELYQSLLKRVPENYSPFKVTHYQHNLNTGKFEEVPG